MPVPEWIDKELSQQLPVLRDRGEGQYLEFMERYPTNGHELSKEIAAFASTNGGTILIGVSDDGTITGLADAVTAIGRDTLCRRIEGVCTGHVRPSITPTVKFATEQEAIVLAIEVPRGRQPIYYNNNTPYVRHLSRSRPAEPHEVIERVQEWLGSQPAASPQEDKRQRLVSSLAPILVDVLAQGEEIESRSVNPWFDLLRSQFGSLAEGLRDIAAESEARAQGIDVKLLEIADLLEKAVSHRLTLGRESWNKLTKYVGSAVQEATVLKSDIVDGVRLTSSSQAQIRESLQKAIRQLSDLDRRADSLANDGRIEELQSEGSRLGLFLLRLSYYDLDFVGAGFAQQLRPIARRLHLLETERLYMDGGASLRRILGILHQSTQQVMSLCESFKFR